MLPSGYIHPRVRELYQRPFFEQGTIEWLQQREDFLTASDAGAVLGNSFFKDRKTLLGIKVGRKMHWVHEGEFMEIEATLMTVDGPDETSL